MTKLKGIYIKCLQCQKEFYVMSSKKDSKKFCSSGCRSRYEEENRELIYLGCLRCGKEFRIKPSQKGVRKFCSLECRGKYTRETHEPIQHTNNCSCLFCGKEFYRTPAAIKDSKEHFCSKKCLEDAHKKVEVICKMCGKEFYVSPSQLKNGKKFCSNNCAHGFRRGKKIPHIKNNCKCLVCEKEFFMIPSLKPKRIECCSKDCIILYKKSKKIEKICEHCGVTFYIVPAREKEVKVKFCSKQCYKDAHKKIELICKTCGKTFYLNPHKVNKGFGIYCSKPCRAKDLLGEGNPNWCEGNSFGPYCPKFNEDLKRRVRAYFGYKCLVCGKTTEENGRQLDVHHIEYNKKACCDGKPFQFAALCQSCHFRTTPKVNREYWETVLHRIIDEMYGGRSYFTKEEWKVICKKSI
ncbi:MAG: hypothetical protein M0R80_04330 [Proteobacteria bacterium]|nr:hypothetical protein [Pseudomonadota bacterium]